MKTVSEAVKNHRLALSHAQRQASTLIGTKTPNFYVPEQSQVKMSIVNLHPTIRIFLETSGTTWNMKTRSYHTLFSVQREVNRMEFILKFIL